MIGIAASILSADFSRLGEQLREVFAAGVQGVHVDVMDGQFVPNLGMVRIPAKPATNSGEIGRSMADLTLLFHSLP